MIYKCDMIRDLLPLYQDGICSESSRQAVETHLAECAECRSILEAERSSTALEGIIGTERAAVLNSQARYFKRKSAVAGTVIAGLFMLPVLICLIVNLAQGGLTWFLIVLAAMLIPFSLVAVPLLAPEHKGLWTLGSFTVSLLMLLAVCSIYSGGSWFFIAAPAVLFGLSVIFAPFVVRSEPVAAKIGRHKALTVLLLDTSLFVAMMLGIGFTNGLGLFYYRIAASVTLPIIGLVWVLFLLIRYLPLNGLLKAAACLCTVGTGMLVFDRLWNSFGNTAGLVIEVWNREFFFSTNAATAVFCIILGLVFAVPGIILNQRRNRK